MARSCGTFDEARRYAPYEIARVEVPYEQNATAGVLRPGHRARGRRRPAAVFICGLDTTKELWVLRARTEFAERGISALFIDTPGMALRLRGLVTRQSDLGGPGLAVHQPRRSASAWSARILGAHHATRAAAFEPRLRAAVAWGVIYDYREVRERLALGGAVAAPKFQLMFVTGADTMEGAIYRVRDFRVQEIGSRVSVPAHARRGRPPGAGCPGDVRRHRFARQGDGHLRRRKRWLGALPVRQPSSCAAGMRRLACSQACTMKALIGRMTSFHWTVAPRRIRANHNTPYDYPDCRIDTSQEE